jgi:hypothetical protein
VARRGRALERQKAFTPLVVAQLQTIEDELGGRAALVGLLTLAPLNPDLSLMLGLLGDPTFSKQSLAEICATGNILPGDLLKHLESAALLRGRVLSAQIVGRGMPAVVADVMMRAAPFEAPCSNCQGVGTVTAEPTPTAPNPGPEPCGVCRGLGKLIYPPDIEHQKLALEMGRVLPKSGGLTIMQNNATLHGGGTGMGSLGSGSLERLHAVTDQILYKDEDPLDAEVLGTPDEPLAESPGEAPE